MNDDDGLILNFAIPSEKPSLPVPHRKPRSAPLPGKSIRRDPRASFDRKKSKPQTSSKPVSENSHFQSSSLFTSNPDVPSDIFSIEETTASESSPSNGADSTSKSSFALLGISEILASHLSSKLSITSPTLVQRKAIPQLIPSQPKSNQNDSRDVIIQAETGSGKTLAFLLPILQQILFPFQYSPSQSAKDYRDRSTGPLALILSPTRELAQQIVTVLESLTNIPPSLIPEHLKSNNAFHWLVPGIVVGGDKKKSEKARLRKGVNILVSTPGRLLDHLKTTKSLHVGRVKWLILDEADRLLDLGFEENIKEIISILNEKSKSWSENLILPKSWPKGRQTILCSATMQDKVQRLASYSMKNPHVIDASGENNEDSFNENSNGESKLSTPTQLTQSCLIVPLKLRLVMLSAILKAVSEKQFKLPNTNVVPKKVVVFLSCCDSVDFHFTLFSNAFDPSSSSSPKLSNHQRFNSSTTHPSSIDNSPDNSDDESPRKLSNDDDDIKTNDRETSHTPKPTCFPSIPIFKLHGSLPQAIRRTVLSQFNSSPTGILITTDVSSRGLDIPHLDLIIQYDPPTDISDYVHRVGRTARIGNQGEAVLFLSPSEAEYVKVLKSRGVVMRERKVEEVGKWLMDPQKEGKTVVEKNGKKYKYKLKWEDKATEWQLKFERWINLDNNIALATEAYSSYIKAYATHPSAFKHIFHVRRLHLGHLAKSFGLRDPPTQSHTQSKKRGKDTGKGSDDEDDTKPKKRKYEDGIESYKTKAARMMKKEIMGEFNIGTGMDIAKLLKGKKTKSRGKFRK